jgi:hypothetical protein
MTLTRTRNGLVIAAALAALVFAHDAAAATQQLSVDHVTDDHAWATAPGRWHIESCEGFGYDASGDEIAWAGLGRVKGEQKAEVVFEEHSGVVVDARVDCDLTKRVVSPRRWRWVIKRRDGVETSSRSRSGTCSFRSSLGTLTLGCRGGGHAVARYHLPPVPPRARHVSRRIIGSPAADDMPGGSVRKSIHGDRGSVRVTGWRAYDVLRTQVRYEVKKREVREIDGFGSGTTL